MEENKRRALERRESKVFAKEEPSSDDSEAKESEGTELDFTDNLPPGICWAATRQKVHFMNGEDFPPFCLQRQGTRARTLARTIASGSNVLLARIIGVKYCEDCIESYNVSKRTTDVD